MAGHTPGPWNDGKTVYLARAHKFGLNLGTMNAADEGQFPEAEANARLIAAAPDLLEALTAVQKIIVDGAMVGFNYKDGDWAERLYDSNQATSRAIAKVKGKS